jgi:hypothetical protein
VPATTHNSKHEAAPVDTGSRGDITAPVDLSPASTLRLLQPSAREAATPGRHAPQADTRVPSPGPPARELGLDYLRVFGFAVLILYHCTMPFVSVDWIVDNERESAFLEGVALFCSRWRLPLLFFISGAAVCFSLQRRSWRQFARDRVHRLLLPLLFGMFIIVPPQIYFERAQSGASAGSFAEFYPEVLRLVPYPVGSFGWLHLWFLAYVLVFSLAGLPVLLWLKNNGRERVITPLTRTLETRPLAVYGLALPSILATVLLSHRWPVAYNLISDWANVTSSLILFVWGFVFASEPRLLALLTRRRREFLCFSGVMMVLLFGTARVNLGRGWAGSDGDVWTAITSSCLAMGCVFALVGYARATFTCSASWLPWATEAVYPFYIVHQTITAAAAFYVVRWPIGLGMKFALIAAATFLGSWAVFELARRIPLLRPLFGLKGQRANTAAKAARAAQTTALRLESTT